MTDLNALLAVSAAFFIVAASPGPANLACALVAMRGGRRAGLRFGAGLALGLACWGLLAALGLGALLQTSEKALIVLKLLGAAYLFWLAFQSGLSVARPAARNEAVFATARLFRQGLLLNLSNPKAVFAWMAALSMGLDPAAGASSVLLLTSACALIGWLNYIGWAYLFSLEPAVRAYGRLRRGIDAAMSGLFTLAGFSLVRSAFVR